MSMPTTPPTPPPVRPAREEDLPVIAALEQELFGAEAWSLEGLRTDLANPDRTVLVAPDPTDTTTLRGYALTTTAGEIADLLRIGVAPEARRGGVATALLDECLAETAQRGADRMLLEVSARNRSALAFYTARGFTQIDTRPRYYADGADALILRRSSAPTCSWR